MAQQWTREDQVNKEKKISEARRAYVVASTED